MELMFRSAKDFQRGFTRVDERKHLRVSPVDKDGDGNDDHEDKADHHGNHLMHCNCTCKGEKG